MIDIETVLSLCENESEREIAGGDGEFAGEDLKLRS